MPSTRFPGQQLSASLTMLMLGMLGLVVLMDVGATSSGVGLFARVAYWTMAIGVATGLVALTAQLVDLVTTAADAAGRPHLGILGAGTTGMLVTFAGVWWVREDGRPGAAPLLALEAGAFVIGLAAAVYARRFLAGGPPPRPATMFPSTPYRAAAPGYRSAYRSTVPYRVTPPYTVTGANGSTVPRRMAPPPYRPMRHTPDGGHPYRDPVR